MVSAAEGAICALRSFMPSIFELRRGPHIGPPQRRRPPPPLPPPPAPLGPPERRRPPHPLPPRAAPLGPRKLGRHAERHVTPGAPERRQLADHPAVERQHADLARGSARAPLPSRRRTTQGAERRGAGEHA